MYRCILLAYDGSLEGRTALREGALLAQRCGSEVFLLSVAGHPGVLLADGAFAGVAGEQQKQLKEVFDTAVERLRMMGVRCTGRLVVGDPASEICAFAREVRADLVVVGHRKKSLLERWWSGSSGAYLSDQLSCSLLVSRNVISDDAFYSALDGDRTEALGA
jgi:nucleotide-binding universal stress UspA family protein